MSELTLEACLALRKLGYPQESYESHYVYYRMGKSEEWQETCYFDDQLPLNATEYVQRPGPIEALRHCAELGYRILVSIRQGEQLMCSAWHEVCGWDREDGNGVSDIILIIAEHHRQHAAQGGRG